MVTEKGKSNITPISKGFLHSVPEANLGSLTNQADKPSSLSSPRLCSFHSCITKWRHARAHSRTHAWAFFPQCTIQHGQFSQLLLLINIHRFILIQEKRGRKESKGLDKSWKQMMANGSYIVLTRTTGFNRFSRIATA